MINAVASDLDALVITDIDLEELRTLSNTVLPIFQGIFQRSNRDHFIHIIVDHVIKSKDNNVFNLIGFLVSLFVEIGKEI